MKQIASILFVADASIDDSAALQQALSVANENQAKLTVASVMEVSSKQKHGSGGTFDQVLDTMLKQRHEDLESMLSQVEHADADTEIKVLKGKVFIEIIREVIDKKHDLLIKSVEPIERLTQHFTSTDMKLLRKCPCPVWIIKSAQQQGYREILAALDYDPHEPETEALNKEILDTAISLALSDFAELHVIHAWRMPHESFYRSPRSGFSSAEVDSMVKEEEEQRRLWLTELVQQRCSKLDDEAAAYLKPQIHLIEGTAGQAVPELAEKLGAELIVMGTVGRTGVAGLIIGNSAESILQKIRSSVLAIKPQGFVSPVSLS